MSSSLNFIYFAAKYALLLYNMAKLSHGAAERFLKEAESLVKFQLRHGNDLLTMDSIRDCDVNLKEQGNLLRQVASCLPNYLFKFMNIVLILAVHQVKSV